ncbi:MAG: hypothetical protein KAU22_03745, partial [Desulfuromonadales bacterium]|nr:hypothetical protein [Desulfuromonadales bacterium]
AELKMESYKDTKTRLADNEVALKLMYPFETAANRTELNQSLSQDENRLGMLLFVSTQDKQVAAAMGQYTVDGDLTGSKRRLYTVEVYAESTLVASHTTAVNIEKAAKLPIVWEIKAHMFKWGVGLKWAGYEPFTSFNIYRRGLMDEKFTQINTAPVQVQSSINQDGTISIAPYFYTDTTIKEHQVFYYQVRGVDFFGDEGPASIEVMGKIKKDPRPAPLPRPELDAGETSIKVTWKPSVDKKVVAYNIYRSLKYEGGYKKQNHKPLTKLTYLDTNVTIGINYFYYITVINDGGFESIPSLAVLGFTKDATPPAVVATLSGKVVAATINLNWTKVDDADLAGYRIYRTLKPEGIDWALLNKEPLEGLEFADVLTENLSRYPYYYRVTSIDIYHNESAPSMVVKLQLPDVTAPQVPTISEYVVENEQVVLNWRDVVVYDIAGYHVYRTGAKGEQKLTAKVLPLPTFVDQAAPVGKQVVYTVTAVDITGNESGQSLPLTVMVADATAPVISEFAVTSEGEFAVLKVVSADKDVVGFDVLRSRNDRDYVKVNRRRVTELTYRDHVLQGKRYFYKVLLWDKSANRAESVAREIKMPKG